MFMVAVNRYAVLGLSLVLIFGSYVLLSDPDSVSYDFSGIVSDVKESDNGYVFHLHTSDQENIKCFSEERPSELGYYAVSGEMSDDGGIFFVSFLHSLDSDYE